MRGIRGFTIIEVVVILVVIAVLATIGVLGLNHFLAQSRDGNRAANATIIAESLERYYLENGQYPNCAEITKSAPAVTGTSGVLAGIDQATLRAPNASEGTDNSITCADLLPNTSDDYYAYVGNSSTLCTSDEVGFCSEFTIKYKNELSGTVREIKSRYSDAISLSTLSTPILTSLTSSGPANYTASWGAVAGATSYTVQCSTNGSSWSSGCQATAASTTHQFTNATMGQQRFVRVQAVKTQVGQPTLTSNWSVPLSAYTLVPPPASFTLTRSDPAWNQLQATSTATCTAPSTIEYLWNNGATTSSTTATLTTGAFGTSIVLSNQARCKVGTQYSTYTSATASLSKPHPDAPSGWGGQCIHVTMCASGYCPAGTTSSYLYWRLRSDGGLNGTNRTWGIGYNTEYLGYGWGDGNAYIYTYCNGPWGLFTSAAGPAMFGPGCLPNVNKSICWADW